VGELAGVGALGVAVSADIASSLLGADVVIDFTHASAVGALLRAAIQAKVGVVSGTTRLEPETMALFDRAAEKIAVLWAPNMSIGVQVLANMLKQAVLQLPEYDVEIVETHHNQKADAPSGTATMLVATANALRGDLEPVHGREGQVGARSRHEVGVHALRGGGVVGDHSVHLIGEFDRLEITHRAMSRELFAEGALRAARFLVSRPPGRYSLADVLSVNP
jgi:4-hydroxy-tetrahydrodipicolinate reductase